ncbi:glycosyltransferase family 1 protein [Chitinophaga silvisoli]|uniref:Glycosyltransferase family 1 protein n=2 Tax=Chitinophaga silvisoli TaxID=2291814 RepID=A0A3E1NZU7_9BACT|nr:glycosyltransferase family 1 protein [Chitinophaga silvisoli]
MIRNRDIIIVGLQPWDIRIGSNCKNMAQELSQYNRVLYVNRALDRISAIRSSDDEKVLARKASLRGDTNDLKPVSASLWTLDPRTVLESINWIPMPVLFDRINLVNNKRLAREINQAAKRLGFSNVLLFIDNDFFRAQYLPELLEGVQETIYYIRDHLTTQPYFKKHGVRLEPQLMQKATMVAANSAYLAEYGAKYNKASFDIGQGCDFSWLKAELPAVQQFKSPVIGYVGALITSRLDLPLLEMIATQRPDWTLVLVGPEDEAFHGSVLHQLRNVHFTGNRPAEELPAWISSFDVCINPQVLNGMTIGNYPRKIDEYLALGKPVVATDTVAMRMFAPYVYLCGKQADYITQINTALQEGNNTYLQDARKAFALSHTWEQCIQLMGAYLEQTQNVEA